ncbi:recombinase family protein [Pseudoduganella sp. FT55W]|uniref:Recombinase family protein n=1 Tax=Duganella rivi TaxID=2666083 RepID=A0A7X4GMM2_9BURK|nr:recombinase family protein [Duganella rivi]MYM66236.1 recombinase family protein [Duganella rivi]
MDSRTVPIKAACYARMSTEHQNYSLLHQQKVIDAYAAANGLEICCRYEDAGKSGLSLQGRKALQQLIADVQGNPAFAVILVYDISRWGRFQDVDESAYYEHICRRSGVQVIYCAEQFSNDRSALSSILKYLKRLMAAEYSRELSAKVFSAQCTFVGLGYKAGGLAGYGLRRVLVDRSGKIKQVLNHGERKSVSTDRISLAPGSPSEMELIQRIFKWYVEDGLGETRIAKLLNCSGHTDESGKLWTRFRVRTILTSEKYVGNLVFNRTSFKLKEHFVKNPPEMWIRKVAAFEGIIPSELYDAAQLVRKRKCSRFADEQLFDILRYMQSKHGRVSARLLNAEPGIPGMQVYRHRFGTMGEAYRRAGIYSPRIDHHVQTRRRIAAMRKALMDQAMGLIAQTSVQAARTENPYELLLNESIRVRIVTVRCIHDVSGHERWRIPMGESMGTDFVLAAQLTTDNSGILHYYLFPANTHPRPYVLLRGERPDEYLCRRFEQLADIFGVKKDRRGG